MTSSRILLYVIWLSITTVQYGCAGIVHTMGSQASLTKTTDFSSEKIYPYNVLKELPGGTNNPLITETGIEITVLPFNNRVLRSYDTSLIIPIPVSTPREKEGIPLIQEHPFIIILRMRANGEGSIFKPSGTELFLEPHKKPVAPMNVVLPMNYRDCLDKNPSSGIDVTKTTIPILNKSDENSSTTQWTCIQLIFDIQTPDPSQKFRLKLGDILTPSGEHDQPTIYFSPVTFSMGTH